MIPAAFVLVPAVLVVTVLRGRAYKNRLSLGIDSHF